MFLGLRKKRLGVASELWHNWVDILGYAALEQVGGWRRLLGYRDVDSDGREGDWKSMVWAEVAGLGVRRMTCANGGRLIGVYNTINDLDDLTR